MGGFSSGLLLFYIAVKEASIWVAMEHTSEGREVNLSIWRPWRKATSSQLALSSSDLLSLKPPIRGKKVRVMKR